ncbi:MAG: response regulator [Paenibacillaceae bacterium]|jgi:two-component system response regulator YesN|nr:response regulator [Paenibacillaceae bacterium]
MYNVMLVDDEKYAVKGMAAGVEWESMGFVHVYEAYDVGQAESILQQHSVDIAILDIEMPGKSGLELAGWMREHSPQTEIIFLTGHANFTYAQQALQMGAYRYLLKPVDYDDLADIVVQISSKIKQEREILDYRNTYKKYYTLWESQKPLLVERFWQDAVQERMAFHESSLELALRQYEIPLAPDGKVLPVLISIEKWEMEFGARDEEIMEYAVRKAAEELVLKDEQGAVVAERSGSGLIVFYLSPEAAGAGEAWIAALHSRCEAFIASCNAYFHCRLSCYIGASCAISGLSGGYQLLLAAERRNVTKSNCVLISEEETALEPLPPVPPSQPPGQLSSVISKVMEFARQHPEKGLGREQLAAAVFLNPAYLSRLFRKETGQSLTEFVLEIKIAHAKQLLEQSNLKVGSVAEAIGYTHFSYFAKIFKKMTGLSPYEYRKYHRRIP